MPVQEFSELLDWNNIPDLHTSTINEQCLVFSPSYFSVSIFYLVAVSVVSFCVNVQHFAHIGSLAVEICLIYFQDGSHCGAILLPVSDLMSRSSEGQYLSAYEISSGWLSSLLTYNYFHFAKTIVRHIEILPPVFTLTTSVNPDDILHICMYIKMPCS